LLFLALRDLCDGEISFGFGWGKGFGGCQAVIVDFQLPDPAALAAEWKLAGDYTVALERESERTSAPPFERLTAEHRALASICVNAARNHLHQAKGLVAS
jgi:hypothetical protein